MLRKYAKGVRSEFPFGVPGVPAQEITPGPAGQAGRLSDRYLPWTPLVGSGRHEASLGSMPDARDCGRSLRLTRRGHILQVGRALTPQAAAGAVTAAAADSGGCAAGQ